MQDGRTALMDAAKDGLLKVLHALLRNGANLEAEDKVIDIQSSSYS